MIYLLPIFFFLSLAQPSFAQAPADATREHHEVNPEAGYKSGFFIQTRDQNFQLKLKGRVQPLFKIEKQTDKKGNLNFQMRRASVSLTALVHKDLTLSTTLLHAPNENYNNAQFAYVTAAYQIAPAFVVTAGMVGLPLDLMSFMSTSDLLFIEPPLTATRTDDAKPRISVTHFSFGAPDGLGVQFSGDSKKIHYLFSLVNGNEDNFNLDETNKRISFGGNMAFDILDSALGTHSDLEYSAQPKLTGNFGFNYQGKRVDTKLKNKVEELSGATINQILTGTSGLQFRHKGFAINAEGYVKKTGLANRGNASIKTVPDLSLTDLGYYVTSGYFLVPKKLELAGTWSYIRREGPDNDSYEIGGAANYYIHGRDLKLTLQYTRSTFYVDIIGDRNSNLNRVIFGLNGLF